MATETKINRWDTASEPIPTTTWAADGSLRQLRVSVVIPAMNEAQNLPHVLPRIPDWAYEIILVDGHSVDDTVQVARQLCPDIVVVQQQGRGKGAALRSGFQAATGDIVVMLDADGSTDPAEIPDFVQALVEGADYAKGSRYLRGGGSEDISLFRSLGNSGLLLVARTLFGCRFTDLCYGYNAFWRRVLPALDLDADGFEIETLMNLRAARAGLRITEVPSFEACRIFGESRLRALPDGWRVLKTIFREWLRPRAIGHTSADDLRVVEQVALGLDCPTELLPQVA
jgi:glycosyltransferase involved in cell wall biosynthesis